jgi:hypothetical protein
MNVLISSCSSRFGFRFWSRRDAALRRLAHACLEALPSARVSDSVEFHTRGIIDSQSSLFKPSLFKGKRVGPRGTFYLRCNKQLERQIVELVRQALHDIGLEPGKVVKHSWRLSRYQIPITGIPRVTDAEVWFNTVKGDDTVILVAVSLTA